MDEAGTGGEKSHAASLRGRWFRLSVVCCGVIAMFWILRGRPWTPMRIAGVCLMIPSLALWIVAQFQLGDSFSITPQARALVTQGIYSRIRNPIYVFSTIFFAGIMLFFGMPVLLLFFLAIIPVQIVRARKEAAVLEAKFGDAYREYRRKVWF
ncbi:MAG: isoprenylcysteine carboxylmethyltransferase family protein [Candidatus Acidiferrales bacterium]